MTDTNNSNAQQIPGNEGNDPEKFYETFKQRLEDVETFPQDYSFKFIVKKTEEQVDAIKQLFTGSPASFSYADSKTGEYTSVRVLVPVQSAAEVVGYYKEAGKLKDVFVI